MPAPKAVPAAAEESRANRAIRDSRKVGVGELRVAFI